jgi:hypothetical protein
MLPRSDEPGSRAAAVADALSTAFMLLPPAKIEGLCRQSPGLEVYRLPVEEEEDAALVHWGRPSGSDTQDGTDARALASRAPIEE